MSTDIRSLLGSEADMLLDSYIPKIPKTLLTLPSSDFIDQTFLYSDRTPQVLKSLRDIYGHGRLGWTGYLSILPVDQGIEHTANASFTPNPEYFDPENIIKLAIDGGCNAVATTFGAFASVSRKYVGKIPFIVKINHNEQMQYPNTPHQILFGTVEEAWRLGATAVGATVYFGSPLSREEISEIALAFERAHELGMATVLWCYLRNDGFKKDGVNYENATDLVSQANHLWVTIKADIIKQKMSETNNGFSAIGFWKEGKGVFEKHIGNHPIDMTRYQVLNCYAGKIGLINSWGESKGESDLADAVRTAVINKRAGWHGLISGRKAFQKSHEEWVKMLHAIQDVYLDTSITIA